MSFFKRLCLSMWNMDIQGVPFIHLMFVFSKNVLVDLMNVDKLGFWELYLCICVFVYLFSMEVFIRSFCNCSCLRLYDNSSASFLLASPWEKNIIFILSKTFDFLPFLFLFLALKPPSAAARRCSKCPTPWQRANRLVGVWSISNKLL